MKNETALNLFRLVLGCALSLHAHAAVYNVNSSSTLVSAVGFANAAAGPHTINLAPGTYNLTGELPVIAFNRAITFQGTTTNPADTVLHQMTAGTRILETDFNGGPNNIVLTFNNLTFDNGQGGDYGGGALLVGGIGSATTVSNCVFTNNRTATGMNVLAGGALENSPNGNVTVLGCRFTGNSSIIYGGAIDYLNQAGGNGSLLVSNSVFTGNSAVSDGGAIRANVSTGTGTILIIDCSFETNRITTTGANGGRGAAISHVDGPLTANYCRFFGNTAATPANGNTIFQAGGTGSTDATKNWWGANSGPGANDIYAPGGVITSSPWLQLRLAANPSSLATGGSSLLTADLLGLSAGGTVPLATLAGLPASPSTPLTLFSNQTPSLGTLPGAVTQFRQGTATATFASTATGSATLQVTLDAQSLTTNLTIASTVVSIDRATARLILQGVPSTTYTIQTVDSLSLTNWQTAGTALTSAGGQGSLDITLGPSNRFYRAVLP